jgi:hypothetical protein
MRRGLTVGLIVVVAALAAVLGYLYCGSADRGDHVAGARDHLAREAAERRGVEARRAGPSAPHPTSLPALRPTLTPEARARLLAALERAQAARGPAPAPAAAPGGGPLPGLRPDGSVFGELDKEYIRASIRELVPLVRECYENALRDQPDLGGTLTVAFTIAGEPEIGGVVTESGIVGTDAGTLHAGLEECVRETMYGLKLQAPRGGGIVKVRYPFVFRSR